MDNNANWEPGTMPGQRNENAPDGAGGLEGAPDANYLYASQAGHNGTGTGEGY